MIYKRTSGTIYSKYKYHCYDQSLPLTHPFLEKSKAAHQFLTKALLTCEVTLQGLQSLFITKQRIGSMSGRGHPLTSLDGSVEVLDHSYHALLLVQQDLLVYQQVTQKS